MKKNTYKIEVDEKVYLKLKEIVDKVTSDPTNYDPYYSMSDLIWDMYRITDEVLRND